jgi:hypothetical protein
MPSAAAVTVFDVPSGNVTFTDEPGSAVPLAVIVPSALAVVPTTGAAGAVVSPKLFVATGEALPAGSVATAVTLPDGCAAADVAE